MMTLAVINAVASEARQAMTRGGPWRRVTVLERRGSEVNQNQSGEYWVENYINSLTKP